jgi:hypothetical protein
MPKGLSIGFPRRLLPEQLKAMLKALAQSNLLRGDTR